MGATYKSHYCLQRAASVFRKQNDSSLHPLATTLVGWFLGLMSLCHSNNTEFASRLIVLIEAKNLTNRVAVLRTTKRQVHTKAGPTPSPDHAAMSSAISHLFTWTTAWGARTATRYFDVCMGGLSMDAPECPKAVCSSPLQNRSLFIFFVCR